MMISPDYLKVIDFPLEIMLPADGSQSLLPSPLVYSRKKMRFVKPARLLYFLFPCSLTTMVLMVSTYNCTAQTTDSVTLYLSFDDGLVKGSQALPSLAASRKIPVNLFVIGAFVCKNDTSRLLWEEVRHSPWLETGNHSFSHANEKYYLYYRNPSEVVEDFQKNQDSLGFTNNLARLPGRNVWRTGSRSRDDLPDSKAIADSLFAKGYKVIGWDIEWNYSGTNLLLEPADDFIFRIRQCIRYNRSFTPQHIVILCHDPVLEKQENEAILHDFITKIRKAGNFRFRFLSEYPASR